MDLQVIPLHRNKEYMQETCLLINDEWKRSETARMRSLESSCDQLPTCLILVDNNKVMGHLKLTPIPKLPDSCFLESVVIKKRFRGRGLGSILMKGAEDYCLNELKLKCVYLSTKGQESFYIKLGYKECPPISIYGSYSPNNLSVQQCNSVKINNFNSKMMVNGPPPPPMPQTPNVQTGKTFMVKYLS